MSRTANNTGHQTAPVYGLYGDLDIDSDPGFVHIEEIVDRSSDAGWRIKPHRHSHLFQVLCIFDGELEVQLGEQTHALSGNWIVTVPPALLHGFRFKPDSDGFVLSVADPILSNTSGDPLASIGSEFLLAPHLFQAQGTEPDYLNFLATIEMTKREFRTYRPDQRQALELLCKLTLMALRRLLRQEHLISASTMAETRSLVTFRTLVENHYREHWSVARYAEELHLSTSTLNRLCHKCLDRSPKSILQERVYGEAKRRLIYTQQSLEEIADTLGFKDQAYFARFFKKMAGETAGSFRRHTNSIKGDDG